MNETAKKIKIIYEELLGYMSQIPSSKDSPYLHGQNIWAPYEDKLVQLEEILGQNLSSYRLALDHEWDPPRISTIEYRTKMNGLIMRLRAEHFPDLDAPFSGSPRMVVNQSQNPSVQVSILLEIQSTIDKQLYDQKTTADEKSFLKKVKDSLGTVRDVASLVALIAKTAADFGISPETIFKLFSK